MKLVGWDEYPTGAQVEFDFSKAPLWLRSLARTVYFEKFAYPLAVKRGLGTLRYIDVPPMDRDDLEKIGWVIKIGEKSNKEKFIEGSLAVMQSGMGQPKRIKFRPAFTRWGRTQSMRKTVHKSNGTYRHFKNGTFPQGL